MKNTVAQEVELGRENRIVLTRNSKFEGSDISKAIGILNREANAHLRLRKNSVGESPVRGNGTVLGTTMILNVTIPLDSRYEQTGENDFNRAWSYAMRDELQVMSGGYVAREGQEEVVKTRVVVETEASAEEIAKLLGGFGRVVN